MLVPVQFNGPSPDRFYEVNSHDETAIFKWPVRRARMQLPDLGTPQRVPPVHARTAACPVGTGRPRTLGVRGEFGGGYRWLGQDWRRRLVVACGSEGS
jgi:hypothetical protein